VGHLEVVSGEGGERRGEVGVDMGVSSAAFSSCRDGSATGCEWMGREDDDDGEDRGDGEANAATCSW
jgi:hypothetical protein